MTQTELDYTGMLMRVRYRRLGLGCALVACAGVTVFVAKYAGQMYVRASGAAVRQNVNVVLQTMPMMMAAALVATAAWLLSGVTPRSGPVKTILALAVVGAWVLGRVVTDALTLVNVFQRLPLALGPALYGIVAGLLALVVVVAAIYFVRLGGLIGQRAVCIIAAVLLLPSVLLSLGGMMYPAVRVVGVYNPDAVSMTQIRSLGNVYTTMYDINFGLLTLVFGAMAVFGFVKSAGGSQRASDA